MCRSEGYFFLQFMKLKEIDQNFHCRIGVGKYEKYREEGGWSVTVYFLIEVLWYIFTGSL